jgi:hypothetical protein
LKTNYERHILTLKHTERVKVSQNVAKISLNVLKNESLLAACKYCGKQYKHASSVSKHIKYSCTKNKDEDVKELIRLMNLQLEQQKHELKQKDKQLETQAKQITKLVGKLEINGSFNTTINVQLLSYKDTDLTHLTDKDYAHCIKSVNFCVKSMIEKIHFNPSKPENMNIYISNLKDKYMMMYENRNWNMKYKSELDVIYAEKEMMLEQWLEEGQYKYPEIKQKFIQYLNNKDSDDNINWIKQEIKLMMYNKTKLIEN